MEINGNFLSNKISMFEEVARNPQKYQNAKVLFSKTVNPNEVFAKLKPEDAEFAKFNFRLVAERMYSVMDKAEIKFNLQMIDECAKKINNYFRSQA